MHAPSPLAPNHWRDGLTKLVHTNLGHLGHRKVAAEISRSLWWPSMQKSVRAALEPCEHCNLSKAHRRVAHGQYTAGSGGGPAEQWGFDFYGHSDGEILTIVELNGSYVMFEFLEDRSAERVAETLLRRVRFVHAP